MGPRQWGGFFLLDGEPHEAEARRAQSRNFRRGQDPAATAAELKIPENRLSELVCGWVEPREDEKNALARLLNRPVAALFGNE